MAAEIGDSIGDRTGPVPMPLTDEELEEMFENSKLDHFQFVGSDIRRLVREIQRLRAKLKERG